MEFEEAPEWGYTNRNLCEVEDRAGADKYFASIMTRLKPTEGEDPLVTRWSIISGSSQVWTEGPSSGEYLRGALLPALAKQVYECPSEELMDRADKSAVWRRVKELEDEAKKAQVKLESLRNQQRELELEIRVMHSSLDGAWGDRARLEGDVLSLT
ncbi:hypothetical protein GW17_00021207 [Ensete ventricosum]|nr:hypothetical protein GW17_00021207 [Ensete ventricosum]